MSRQVRDVYYNVTDMKRAVKFYTEALGLTVAFGDEYWTSLRAGNVSVGLHWTEGEAIPVVPRDPHGAHAGGTVTFASEDIGADRERLANAGATILGESRQPWGHMLVVEDLDGNVFKLMKG